MGCLVALYRRRLTRKTYIPPNYFFRKVINTLCTKCIYNCTIMTIADWAGLILTILSIIAALGIGLRWVIRHYLKDVLHELKPNSGSSLKDQVTRLESDVLDLKSQNVKGEEYHEKLDQKIDNLTELFIKYVSRQK